MKNDLKYKINFQKINKSNKRNIKSKYLISKYKENKNISLFPFNILLKNIGGILNRNRMIIIHKARRLPR